MAIEHRIYSCDDHLDIYNLPRDLWTKRLPATYHEAAPHVVENPPLDGREGLHGPERTLDRNRVGGRSRAS